jgi:hypothetical protein
MAGLDDLIDAYPSLAPVANAFGMKRRVIDPAELPRVNEYGIGRDLEPLGTFPRSTRPEDLPEKVNFYRADPTGKYGGKEGLETLPKTFSSGSLHSPGTLYKYARLAGAADKYGYPTMSPEDIAAFAVKEGRSDLGHNAVMGGSKKDKEFDKHLGDTYNIPASDKNFLYAMHAKQKDADRLDIPLAEAWNGTGRNVRGTSGKQYAQDWESHKQAAVHPKNADLMNLIKRAYVDGQKHGLPLKANADEDSIAHVREVPYKRGGMIDKPLAGGYKTI